MDKLKVLGSILLLFLLIQYPPSISNSAREGQLHTTVSYIDLIIKSNDGGDQYQGNVTVFDISTSIEVWNTGSEPQSIGYNWYNFHCGYYLNVGVNITDEVEIYKGDLLYQTQCGMTEKYFDPGLTTENALVRLVFNSSKLVKLPSGEYNITAPTRNGIAYQTILYSNEGFLHYKSQELPSNWEEVGYPNTDDYTCLDSYDQSNCVGTEVGNTNETALLPISLIGLFLSFLTIITLRNFTIKGDPNRISHREQK